MRGTEHSCSGGGVFTLSNFALQNGNLQFLSCQSKASGGGISVGGNFIQEGGSVELESCTAQSGGGIQTHGSFKQDGGNASFHACQALLSGGGMDVQQNISLKGASSFVVCAAGEGQERGHLAFSGLHNVNEPRKHQ